MRTLYVGSKQPRSKSKASLGTKVYGGIRSMGQKVYDNRWKILGSGASLAASAAMNYMSGSSGVGENNLGQTMMPNFPSVPKNQPTYRAMPVEPDWKRMQNM